MLFWQKRDTNLTILLCDFRYTLMITCNRISLNYLPSGRAVLSSISAWMILSFLTNLIPVMILFESTSLSIDFNDQYLSELGPGASHLQKQYEQCQNNHLHQLSTFISSEKSLVLFYSDIFSKFFGLLREIP